MAFLCAAAIFRVGAPALAQNGDLDCEDFSSQRQAQNVYNQDPSDPNGLDADGDGIACEEPSGGSTASPNPQPAPPVRTTQPQPRREEVVRPPKTDGISYDEFREIRKRRQGSR